MNRLVKCLNKQGYKITGHNLSLSNLQVVVAEHESVR